MAAPSNRHWLFDEKVTRAALAMITMCVFLGLLAVPLLLLAGGRMSEPETSDLLKTIAAVAGGPVGIIVGFYFSDRSQAATAPPPAKN